MPGLLALFAAALSWLSLWLLIPLLSRRLLDQPNARSSHQQPTPRGGGVAFVLVASGFAFPFGFVLPAALPLIALPLAIVGFLDDRHNLPASLRYGVQVATALFLLWISPLSALAPGFWVWLLLLIAATAVINFTNFMDGLDGLVAGCMAVLFAVAGLWPLVGALLGFLLWNWSPAKVFMGDVGSTFLGAVFAGVVLQQTSFSAALALLLVATPLLADACLCVPRRLFAGQRIFQAHRLHLFQRLHQAGWCHAHVSSLYIAATALLAIAQLAGGLAWVIGFALAVLLIGVWLDQRVAVPFAVASKS
ncbi:glycosyltransferase family 4 protein [Synechococcus lacustris Maggiore-St4-Slac]|nr:glycosyltransferase family 4 protein [Synechococcus lacustris Maggiore-St4-Slac]